MTEIARGRDARSVRSFSPPRRGAAIVAWFLLALAVSLQAGTPSPRVAAFIEENCANCHNDIEDRGSGLDLTSLAFAPQDQGNYLAWIKIHDRVEAGEMPPRNKPQPEAAARRTFLEEVSTALTSFDRSTTGTEGRATRRRLNAYEYENALRDLLSVPWLRVRDQFPPDGEAYGFNKIGSALETSSFHLTHYMAAADTALHEAMNAQLGQTRPTLRRNYARDQRSFTNKFIGGAPDQPRDLRTYPVVGLDTPQPEVARLRAPLSDPGKRETEAVAFGASNHGPAFDLRWDEFRAPTTGRYRVRFSGYTLWTPPFKLQMRFDANERYQRDEPIVVYARNGQAHRRVGEFDLTPTPAVHDIGEVWLEANETLAPDPARFFRPHPTNFPNPLKQPDGAPGVAFRWMEVEGPFAGDATTAGYRLLFGELPLEKVPTGKPGVTLVAVRPDDRAPGRVRATPLAIVSAEVVSAAPERDADRLMRTFVARAYRRPVADEEVKPFLALVAERRAAGLSFAEAMLAGYTAVLTSPAFVFVDETPGRLDDFALATRLSLFLWNSVPDEALRRRAERHELDRGDVLRVETERMLADPKSQRFVGAFLDYWLDLRKMEDTTPSSALYNDYYADDNLFDAAVAESRLFFSDLLQRDLPARTIVQSDFTYLNERLAEHYGIAGVKGVAMRRVTLPPDSVRGGILTQASVLKVTANGTTTSPVLRGKWIVERILGLEIPPPPPIAAIEPDIRGALTIRQQLARHRDDPSCASCHSKMDPAGFALESFDVMGGWRDRYRGFDPAVRAVKGFGKDGQPFTFHYAQPVDASGALPDGRTFTDVRGFKQLLLERETEVARNLARQLVIYATGAPVRFSDRDELEAILRRTQASGHGVRSLVHAVVASELFQNK